MSDKNKLRTTINIENRVRVVPKCDGCGRFTDLIREEGGLSRFVCPTCRRKVLQDPQGIRIYLNYQ